MENLRKSWGMSLRLLNLSQRFGVTFLADGFILSNHLHLCMVKPAIVSKSSFIFQRVRRLHSTSYQLFNKYSNLQKSSKIFPKKKILLSNPLTLTLLSGGHNGSVRGQGAWHRYHSCDAPGWGPAIHQRLKKNAAGNLAERRFNL